MLADSFTLTLAQDGAATGGTAGSPPATGDVQAVGVPGASPATGAPVGPTGKGQPAGGLGPMMWLLPAMLVIMILVSVMGSRKEKKRQADLLASVKKGDKVQMLGGVIGQVIELGDTEIVLRVEEGRIRFAKSALQGVIRPTVANGTLEAKPEAKVTA